MKGEFYKMEFDAWDEGTDDLTLEQEAAYLRLCHHMYRHRAPVPNRLPRLARLWRCHQNKARKILEVLLDTGKIEATQDGHLTNTRVRQELDARETRSTQLSDAGKTGGRRSADNRKKANEIKASEQADASTPVKPNQAEKRREEKKREEEEKSSELATGDDPDAIFREAAATPTTNLDRSGQAYAFEHGIIKLNQKDFDRFAGIYRGLNLEAELMGMAGWVAEQAKLKKGDWYQPMIGALNKKLRQVEQQAREAKAAAEARAKQGARHAPGQMAI